MGFRGVSLFRGLDVGFTLSQLGKSGRGSWFASTN